MRPKFTRKFSVPLLAAPRSKRFSLVGTAFDYLLRFELQRRAPHAVVKPWVAENALFWLGRPMVCGKGTVSIEHDLLKTAEPTEVVAQYADQAIANAKAALASYVKEKAPSTSLQRGLAVHAIRLANLDVIHRAMQLDPNFMDVATDDVEDLVGMLNIVPFDKLIDAKLMLLNPTFGEASLLVGGSDADLIAGDMLVDFKTTKQDEMDVGDLDKMLGYFLLARKCPNMPINRIGLYYARRACLLSFNTLDWLAHPEFSEIEAWFFKRADELHHRPI